MINKNRKLPIERFKTLQDLIDCANEWKQILQLEHWIIRYELVDLINDDPSIGGLAIAHFVEKKALIKIRKSFTDDVIINPNIETILVHELIHLIIPALYKDNMTVSDSIYDMNMHQIVEQMAKALIMSRYKLDYGWFLHR